MLLAASALLLSAALAGVDGTAVDLQASGRTETSAVAFSSSGAGARGIAAMDVLPRVRLLLDHKAFRLTLAYEPQLRVSQMLSYAGGDTAFVQGGAARAEWDLDPLWRATGTATSSVRILDFVATGGDLARMIDLRQAPPIFRYREDAASAGIEGRPTRLLTLGATVSAESSGGIAEGSTAVPGMRQVRVAGSGVRAQTAVDVLRLELAGAGAAFDLGGTASLATVSAGWTRQVTRSLRFHLLGSASDARDRVVAARVLPGGEARLEATPALLGRPLTVSAAFRAGPAFDRFTASVQERAGLDAAAMWAMTTRWSVGGTAMFARVLDELGYSAGRGDLRAEWKASRRMTFYGDVWHEQHRDPAAGAAGSTSYLGTSVGVILAPVPRW